MLAKPNVARALEQALVEAAAWCLASGDPLDMRSGHERRAAVMRRLEEVIAANGERPLYISELCAAVGVSYPTLRICCQEHLGVSPKRYLLLRRMNLTRRALQNADPEDASVTKIATDYGFWELGRFAVAYRSLFGEPPSKTLRRPPDDRRVAEIAAPPWRFINSA